MENVLGHQPVTMTAELYEAIHELEMVIGLCVRNSGELFLILSIQVRPKLEQQHGNLLVPLLSGTHQGRLPLVIPQIHVRSPLNQAAQGVDIVVTSSHVQGGLTLGVGTVDRNAIKVQKFHQLVAPPFHRNVKRGFPVFGQLGQLGAAAVAELGEADVASVACVLQKGLPALHIGSLNVRRLQQPLQNIHEDAAVFHDHLLQIEGHVLGWLSQGLEFITELLGGAAHVVSATVELRHGGRRRLTPPNVHVLDGRGCGRNHLLASASQSPRHPHSRVWSWLLLLLRLRAVVVVPPHVRVHDRGLPTGWQAWHLRWHHFTLGRGGLALRFVRARLPDHSPISCDRLSTGRGFFLDNHDPAQSQLHLLNGGNLQHIPLRRARVQASYLGMNGIVQKLPQCS
mmetsp:Transcript_9224/g.20080  ORF Transcript_9224/g.20080 Transcript_9224/m.20080 type:complete len:398 (+) Transcript_9224:262-1455(+)